MRFWPLLKCSNAIACALFCWVIPLALHGEVIALRGYLDREAFAVAREALEQAGREGREVALCVNSSFGDLEGALCFAQKLMEWKSAQGKTMTVYIQGKAVGAAAIFPFLADRLMVTPLVAWGDVAYRQGVSETEVLAETVQQLIACEEKRAATLRQLAHAMIDPSYQVAISHSEEPALLHKSSLGGDPLILNREGLEALQLIETSDVVDDEAFREDAFYVHEKRIGPASVSEAFQRYLPYRRMGKNLIGYLNIERERAIDQTTFLYVKFALEQYKKKGVIGVVLRLNTPGGEVLSALKIVDLLQKSAINDNIPIIAFIDNWAISAGAMLAYSARFIGVVPTASMGAAEPVFSTQEGGMQTAPEKVNSVLRTEFTNLANFYGRNPLIAQAMVDKDLIVVLRDHEFVALQDESAIRTEGPNPDKIITTKGKLLTLDAKQLMAFGVADFAVPLQRLDPITEKEREEGQWPAAKNLVFQEPYLASIPDAEIISYSDWRLGFFSFLAHPAVAGLLLVGLIVGFYIEINSPGFGVPGSLALACLGLILLSSFASEAIHWLEVIILFAGIILLALELFIIPGFGVVGILGIVLTVIGLFALMLPSLNDLTLFESGTFTLVGVDFFKRLAWLCSSLLVAVGLIVALAYFFSHRFFRFSRLVLQGEQEKKAGYQAGIPREEMPDLGELGETVTPLRPSGKVHIGDNLFDAITQGNYLEAYVAVEVVRVEGSKVVVREVKDKAE